MQPTSVSNSLNTEQMQPLLCTSGHIWRCRNQAHVCKHKRNLALNEPYIHRLRAHCFWQPEASLFPSLYWLSSVSLAWLHWTGRGSSPLYQSCHVNALLQKLMHLPFLNSCKRCPSAQHLTLRFSAWNSRRPIAITLQCWSDDQMWTTSARCTATLILPPPCHIHSVVVKFVIHSKVTCNGHQPHDHLHCLPRVTKCN